MKVRDRLSLQYTLMSGILLFIVLSGIYLLTLQHKRTDFSERLTERAITNAELFLAQDNLSEEKFKDVQRKFPQTLPSEIVGIYNDKNEPVFIKDTAYRWPTEIIDQVRAKKLVYYSQGERQVAGIYYVDNSGNFTVLVSAIDIYGKKQMSQLLLAMFTVFLIAIFIIFFTGQIFAKMALAPIVKVINAVKYIRSSSLHKRLDSHGGKDEINELALTFNNLLEHLEQSFDAQKSFVANASHELRTPITSIMGSIEVTLAQQRESTEYKKTLEVVLTEAAKLNDLVYQLFELAQANMDSSEFQDVRLDELIWQVKDEWTNRMPEAKVELLYDLPEDVNRYTVHGNNYLLFIATGNILKNAIKFSNNKTVTCKLFIRNNAPVLSIEDKGIGIKAEELPYIFRPFYRGKNAYGYPGYGIGLSLADKILRLHNIHLEIRSEMGKGSEFSLIFSN